MDKFWKDAQEKMDKIDRLGLDIMGMVDDITPLMNGFVLEKDEIGHFPRLLAMYIVNDNQTLQTANLQNYVNIAIEQTKENRERNSKVFSIPMEVLEKKYHGCGNGIAVIDKSTRQVIDMDYTTSKLKVIKEQNINMCKSAGKVIKEDDKTITYRANFSSCQVCLF